jgi:hypothetical protein
MATATKAAAAPAEKKKMRNGIYVFTLTEKIQPLIKDVPPYQPKKTLPSTEVVYDEDRGMVRKVRYIDGIDTIFVDEQQERKIDEKWANENAWTPEFIYGSLSLLYPQDELKIMRMMLSDKCKNKKTKRHQGTAHIFELVNTEEASQQTLDMLDEKFKAAGRAREASKNFAAIEAHAKYLGIKYKDSFGLDREPMDIIVDYLRKAEADPATFNKSFDSPMVQASYLVRKALEDGTINVTKVRGEARWSDSDSVITTYDVNKDPFDQLVDYSTSEAGQKFLKMLSGK